MTGEQHIRRLEVLKQKRAFIEPFWKKAFDATIPLRGALIGQDMAGDDALAGAQAAAAEIYDSTLRDSVNILAAALLSGLTPPNSLWLDFNLETEDQAGKKWLSEFAKGIWSGIHNANYDVAGLEIITDYVIAMACLYVEEGDLGKGKMFNFKSWPLHSCFFADSTGKGMVDTLYRPYVLTAEQATEEFTDARYPLSEAVKKAMDNNKPDTPFQFLHAIYPNRKDKQIKFKVASEHVEIQTKRLVRKSGYAEQPFMVLRGMTVPDSVYATGICENGMPDHKTVNELVKLVLSNADMAIAGMWGAVDDGVLNPKMVTVGARKIIAMANKESFFSLKSGAQFDVSALVKKDLQGQIRRSMKADQLHPDNEGPDMTAYEIRKRTEMINKQLIPLTGRLQPEFLSVMVERCAGILLRAAAATNWQRFMTSPPPDSVAQQIATISYKSPLARSQKIDEVHAMDAYEERLGALAQAGVTGPMDLYDVDSAYREKSELLGVPQKHIRSQDDVLKLRKERAKAMAEAQKQQADQEIKKATAPQMMKGMVESGTA